jgi:hypothetical protein
MKTTWKDNPRKGWEASLKMYYPQKPIPLLRKSVSNFFRSLKQRTITFRRDHFGWSEQKGRELNPHGGCCFYKTVTARAWQDHIRGSAHGPYEHCYNSAWRPAAGPPKAVKFRSTKLMMTYLFSEVVHADPYDAGPQET